MDTVFFRSERVMMSIGLGVVGQIKGVYIIVKFFKIVN